jgi:hypothetical protein
MYTASGHRNVSMSQNPSGATQAAGHSWPPEPPCTAHPEPPPPCACECAPPRTRRTRASAPRPGHAVRVRVRPAPDTPYASASSESATRTRRPVSERHRPGNQSAARSLAPALAPGHGAPRTPAPVRVRVRPVPDTPYACECAPSTLAVRVRSSESRLGHRPCPNDTAPATNPPHALRHPHSHPGTGRRGLSATFPHAQVSKTRHSGLRPSLTTEP